MAKTTAERQAAFRQRTQQRLEQCITPDDVRRAVRLLYEHVRSQPGDQSPPWDEWVESCRTRRGRSSWMRLVPDIGDLDAYEDFAPSDAALLAKVGAVYEAMQKPPEE